MKRASHLTEEIVKPDNLREAFLLAARGKAYSKEMQMFRQDLEENLRFIAHGLQTATYDFGHYRRFYVFEPKPRMICAAPFAMRVALHAMMRICHPVFENCQTNDSYASRIGRGTYKALEKAQFYAGRYEWYAKLDVKKYFDSIHHDVLMAQLCRLFRDRLLMTNIAHIIDSYHSVSDNSRGLPIGNLSSQYFANHYLSVSDRFVKERRHVRAMIRYMDDVLLFARSRDELDEAVAAYYDVAECKLRLTLHLPIVNRCHRGIPFLGYVVRPHLISMNQQSRHRLRRKLSDMQRDIDDGTATEDECRPRAEAMLAFALKSRSAPLRRIICRNLERNNESFS